MTIANVFGEIYNAWIIFQATKFQYVKFESIAGIAQLFN